MTRRGLAIALQAVERELGWEPRTAEVLIGTSAGAEMVALLGSGRSVTDAAALDSPPGAMPARWPASRRSPRNPC